MEAKDILWDLIPKSELERLKGTVGEFCKDFMGFVDTYYHLSKIIPKEYTIIDFGSGHNAQSYFFINHKRYISVNPRSGIDMDDGMFCPSNCEIYRMTTGEFLNTIDYPTKMIFAICNYVPNWYSQDSINLVKEHFRNVYTFYPELNREINLTLPNGFSTLNK